MCYRALTGRESLRPLRLVCNNEAFTPGGMPSTSLPTGRRLGVGMENSPRAGRAACSPARAAGVERTSALAPVVAAVAGVWLKSSERSLFT